MYTNEFEALAIAMDPQKLRKRLLASKRLLHDETMARFKRNRFDFTNRCLWSDDGSFRLQWQTRQCPEEPISYHNQQTAGGHCCIRVGPIQTAKAA